MEISSETGLEFLDLKLKIVEGEIKVKIFAKSINNFSCTKPNTSYPKKEIYFVCTGIVLRLRGLCDDDVTFDKRSSEYQNYLIAKEHKPSTVKQQFSEVRNETRAETRKKKTRKARQGK